MSSQRTPPAPANLPARFHPGGACWTDQSAFTLTDLLAGLFMLGFLSLVVLLTAGASSSGNSTFHCLNNLRQLGAALKMYADDYANSAVPNYDGSAAGVAAGSPSWAGGWLDYSATAINTNKVILIDQRLYPYSAHLGPYLRTPTVFKCPSDQSVVPIGGQLLPRARSVSLNEYVGGGRTWSSPSRFTLFTKLTQINAPAQIFTFLDERADSINDACFLSDPDHPYQMIDFPAGYHDGAACFAFVDGHGAIHRWQDARTVPPLKPGSLLTLNVNLPGDVDVTWIQQHASELK